MKNEKKSIPEFSSEAEEQAFWSAEDSTDYVDWEKAEQVLLPNLKPTMKNISLRIPEPMLNRLKVLANERDVPYQSLLKIFLKERLDHELEKGILVRHNKKTIH
jgi:predicted DNA binding CopG/RHH family protein